MTKWDLLQFCGRVLYVSPDIWNAEELNTLWNFIKQLHKHFLFLENNFEAVIFPL